jgi:hypothetical protein
MVRFLKNVFNLILILLILSTGILYFALFRVYHRFTYEKPIAEIVITPTSQNQTSRARLSVFIGPEKKDIGEYLIKGDQWMIEGDVLTLEPWLNFLGFDTHYRLTRLRGRYVNSQEEKDKEHTIYPLVKNEESFFWRPFYRVGQKFPLIKSVYGYAIFQNANIKSVFLVYVNNSGFSLKEISAE